MGIYKVKERRYIDFYADGRRIRKCVGSEKDAENALIAVKADILRGEFRFKRDFKKRFEDFAKEYLEYAKINKRSWRRDEFSLKNLESFFKGELLSRITPRHIEDYKKERVKKVKPATINRELSLLKFMFSLAKKWKLADENPVKEVKLFQEQKIKMKILDKDEIDRLIKAANGYLKSIVTIALNTGMRKGEILNLCWNDIEFDKYSLFIKKTKSGITREVPMNSLVANSLKEIKRENDFVFYNSKTGVYIKDVKNSFKTACQKAGINDLRFHDLRHTAATYMVMGGIDLVTVSEILGHADIKMTMRYAHPTPENKRKAVNVLASIFDQKTEKMDINRSQGVDEAHFRKDLTSLISDN